MADSCFLSMSLDGEKYSLVAKRALATEPQGSLIRVGMVAPHSYITVEGLGRLATKWATAHLSTLAHNGRLLCVPVNSIYSETSNLRSPHACIYQQPQDG